MEFCLQQVSVALYKEYFIAALMIILRIQIRLMPYKLEENNNLDILASTSGTMTLFIQILFATDENQRTGFNILTNIILFVFNFWFILLWSYYFMHSWKIKNEKFNKFLTIFGILLCKRESSIEVSYFDFYKRVSMHYLTRSKLT
jgi:hypothetical protein